MKPAEIAITGIGVICAIGNDRETFWKNCCNATDGIRRQASDGQDSFRANSTCSVRGFDPKTILSPRVYRRMSRVSQMSLSASIEALDDSGLCMDADMAERTAVVFGTSDGPSTHVDRFFLSLLENGPRGTQPLYFPETVPNAPASHVAMYHGIKGPNTTFCQNMISFENAMLYAASLLKNGQADAVLAGGADEISEMQFACYASVGALNKATYPLKGSIVPAFATGFFLGEGAAVLVMEKTAAAVARGAHIYGFLVDGRVAGDAAAIGHYEKTGAQLEHNIKKLLSRTGISPGDIDQILTAANFSRELDSREYDRLRRLFATEPHELPVTPLKYLLGEFGGVGAHRAAAALLSFDRQRKLPTIDTFSQLPFKDNPWQWHIHQDAPRKATLLNSATYGGGCASMLFAASAGNE